MSVVVSYRRTPYGRFLGTLANLSAVELGTHALSHALKDAGVLPDEVDYVIAGQVLQAGLGQNPARQTAVAAGIPLSTPAVTLNAVCLSGAEAISQAHRLITSGEASIVACVGQESMSKAPHLIDRSRTGTKYGPITVRDSIEVDGLTDAFACTSMGLATEEGNTKRGISRADQDDWAQGSHQKATTHRDSLAKEIAAITAPAGITSITVDSDEGIRPDTTADSLGKLKPAFTAVGTITAGNASPLSDGAASVIVMSEAEFARRTSPGLARILSHAFVAGPDTSLHSQPSQAIKKALSAVGKHPHDCSVVEINEAFASVVVQSIRDLDVDRERVNPRGGAIALGHPIGSSGTRIVGSLALQISELGPGSLGAAGICGGGGQGSALILEAL